MVTILDPVGPIHTITFSLAARLRTLKGQRVGILDNAKQNGGLLLTTIAEWLVRNERVVRGTTLVKRIGSSSAPVEYLERLAGEVAFVLTGPGDCGSCTAWSVHDAVQLERRGLPVVMLCSDSFEGLARAQSLSLGMPDLMLAVVPYPISGITQADVVAKALTVAPRVKEYLLHPVVVSD